MNNFSTIKVVTNPSSIVSGMDFDKEEVLPFMLEMDEIMESVDFTQSLVVELLRTLHTDKDVHKIIDLMATLEIKCD